MAIFEGVMMMGTKCIQCGNSNFEKGYLSEGVFMKDKVTLLEAMFKPKRVYGQECSHCGYLILSTKKF